MGRRKSRQKPSGMSDATLVLVAGAMVVVVCGLGILRFGHKGSVGTVTDTSSIEGSRSDAQSGTGSELPSGGVEKLPQAGVGQTTSAGGAVGGANTPPGTANIEPYPEIKARTMELRANEFGYPFHFTLSSDGRCEVGDLDIIGKEMAHSPGAKLLFTIEPLMTGDLESPVIKEIGVDKVTGGSVINLAIPAGKGVRHLGLFICKDSSNDNSCRNKSVVDLNKVYNTYYPMNGSKPPSDDYLASDKIYFFQYLMVQDGQLVVFDPKGTVTAGNDFEMFLRDRLGSPIQARTVANRVTKLNDIILSAPVSFAGQFVRLNLPHLDKAICREVGPKPLSPEQLSAAKQVPPVAPQ